MTCRVGKARLLELDAWASDHRSEGKSPTRLPSPLWRLAHADRHGLAILPALWICTSGRLG